MNLETAVRLLDDIELLGISPRTFGAQVEYQASKEIATPRGTVDIRDIAEEFDVSTEVAMRAFRRLEETDIAEADSERYRYRIDTGTLRTVIDRLEWLSQPENRDFIYPTDSQSPDRIEMITGSPHNVSGIPYPNITGRLVDMIATATGTVTLVNPFFTGDGLDLLLDAMVGAVERDIELRLLTRDVNHGNGSNRTEVTRLFEAVQQTGKTENFGIFEVDKQQFPDASLHAKVTVVDRSRAYVGSANFTDQSLQNAVELGLYVEGGPVKRIAEYLDQCQTSDLFVSVEL